jgi:CubicO group peptidase (beta-lactamase class C family)
MWLVTLAAAAAVSRMTVPPRDPALQPFAAEAAALVRDGALPSLSIGVLKDGHVVWEQSWGYADRERAVPATPRSRYGLASLGKSMTALAALRLVDDGKLSLDVPVTRWLGDDFFGASPCGREPTLRQLLSMTGGVAHGAATYRSAMAPDDELSAWRRSLSFCPGDTYYYSNYSIAVVDRLVEQASGASFGAALAGKVARPLRLRDTALGTPAGYATPVVRYADGTRVGAEVFLPRSSRQLYASLDDLLRYSRFNLDGRSAVLSPELFRAMHEQVVARPDALFALGWGSVALPDGRRWLLANGNDMGVQSSIVLVPRDRVAVVVLANGSGDQADPLAARIADALSPGFAAQVEVVKAGYLAHIQPLAPDSEFAGQWQGVIHRPDGDLALELRVPANGAPQVRIADQPWRALEEPTVQFDKLTGHWTGRLPLEESPAGEDRLELTVVRSGATLIGFVTSNFASDHGKFELPASVVLRSREPG